jgi:peptidoglycan/LPS O-acetylase OafA/YrhL
MLSGFVCAHSVVRLRVDVPDVWWFMLRRSVRLDPPYWVSILATIIVARHLAKPSYSALLAHMFYLQDLLRMDPISPIYWTLCLEIQLYGVFVLLLLIVCRFRFGGTDRRSLFIIFTAAALVASLFPTGLVHEETLMPGLFLRKWYAFLAGAFAYWAVDGTVGRTAFYVYAGALAADALHVHNIDALVSMGVGASLLEVGRAGKLCDWLNYRPLQFLGKISYSLYLMHGPVGGLILAYALTRLTPPTASWELFWLLIALAANCVGAWCFWRLVEAPCIHLARYCRPSNESPGNELGDDHSQTFDDELHAVRSRTSAGSSRALFSVRAHIQQAARPCAPCPRGVRAQGKGVIRLPMLTPIGVNCDPRTPRKSST